MGVRVREKPVGSGEYWIFINHQGKRKSKKIGHDKSIAKKVAEKIKAKLILGELNIGKKSSECPMFKQYAEMWMTLPHDWKPATFEAYQNSFRLHIFPIFGNQRLNEIRRKDVKLFFDQLLTKGKKPAGLNNIRAALSGPLGHAVESELIETNPLNGIKIKQKEKFQVTPLTEAEVDLLLGKVVKYLNGFYYPVFLCSVRTGLRVGEIQALKWSDIDFNNRFIKVSKSWRRGIISSTKNRKSRKVDMTPQLTEVLKELKLAQRKEALKRGHHPSDRVFLNQHGQPIGWHAFQITLQNCLKDAGLPRIRIHDLRHTYATIRLLKGHNIGDVSYQLGHSSISITYDIYGHWIPGQFKSEVDELDGKNAPKRTLYAPGD